MSSKLTKRNQSVEKTLQIIEFLADSREPMKLIDISKYTNMPSSTVLRMVNTLLEKGYAYQEADTNRYGLTLRFTAIGMQLSLQNRIRDFAHYFLLDLSKETGESTCLAIEEDKEVIYIDAIDGGSGMLKITQRIGIRAPMHSTGVGKLMLTEFSPEALELLQQQKGLTKLTNNTLTTLNDLNKELDAIRVQGYAIDNEECEIGARCVAAPIRNYENKIVAAISVSGPVSRMTLDRIPNLSKLIIETANKISVRLGHFDE